MINKAGRIPYFEIAPGTTLQKMGIGTWGVGGYMKKSQYNDDGNDVLQLNYLLDCGLTMIDAWLAQAEGHMVKLLAQALANRKRESYFVVTKLDVIKFQDKYDVEKITDQYLKSLNINYVDVLQIHLPQYEKVSEKICLEQMNLIIKRGKAKHLAISNATWQQIKRAQNFSEAKLIFNEVNYSVLDRTYDTNGTIKYCEGHGIKIMSFKPLSRGAVNSLSSDKVFFKPLADKYSKTVNQVALNWLMAKPNVGVWVKSVNRSHINENLDSMSFQLSEEDRLAIDNYSEQKTK